MVDNGFTSKRYFSDRERMKILETRIFHCLFLCLKLSSTVEHVSREKVAGARGIRRPDMVTWRRVATWEHLTHVDQRHNEA